jgi:hypothetical protein
MLTNARSFGDSVRYSSRVVALCLCDELYPLAAHLLEMGFEQLIDPETERLTLAQTITIPRSGRGADASGDTF